MVGTVSKGENNMVKFSEEIMRYGYCDDMYISTEIKEYIDALVDDRYNEKKNLISEECDNLGITGRAKASLIRKVSHSECKEEIIEELVTDSKVMKFFGLKLKAYKGNIVLVSRNSYPITFRVKVEEETLFTEKAILPR